MISHIAELTHYAEDLHGLLLHLCDRLVEFGGRNWCALRTNWFFGS